MSAAEQTSPQEEREVVGVADDDVRATPTGAWFGPLAGFRRVLGPTSSAVKGCMMNVLRRVLPATLFDTTPTVTSAQAGRSSSVTLSRKVACSELQDFLQREFAATAPGQDMATHHALVQQALEQVQSAGFWQAFLTQHSPTREQATFRLICVEAYREQRRDAPLVEATMERFFNVAVASQTLVQADAAKLEATSMLQQLQQDLQERGITLPTQTTPLAIRE